MRGVHVRLNLKHKAGKGGIVGLDESQVRLPGLRGLGHLQKPRQQGFHAEVGDRAAKKHGRERAGQNGLDVKGVPGLVQQQGFFHQPVIVGLTQHGGQGGVVYGDQAGGNAALAVIARLV